MEKKSLSTLSILAPLALAIGLGMAFFYAPADAVQGQIQRIMYLHVPMVWTSFIAVFILFLASCLYLWERAPRWDRLASSAAELGLLFITLGICTGSIWGRPTWGTWWVWDARLTSTAILGFMLFAYIMLRRLVDDPEKRARFCAILGIIATIDVPIIHVSVLWWRTLHQPPTLMNPSGTPPIADSMKYTLLVNLVAWLLVLFYFLKKRIQLGRVESADESA